MRGKFHDFRMSIEGATAIPMFEVAGPQPVMDIRCCLFGTVISISLFSPLDNAHTCPLNGIILKVWMPPTVGLTRGAIV